ncbi:hypothetical protein BDU57DRAFT_208588 [Ampelomyces quisqualis]|uniref:Uncharacterized protein n=1 Tax=Ampelomyces quisqualis TaxID=50730 RepID=A0A6A5QJS1_AMPQU|nr:hypothetical protein BDU57DRAFT_208588 [Ampelomyces quisqualis]
MRLRCFKDCIDRPALTAGPPSVLWGPVATLVHDADDFCEWCTAIGHLGKPPVIHSSAAWNPYFFCLRWAKLPVLIR